MRIKVARPIFFGLKLAISALAFGGIGYSLAVDIPAYPGVGFSAVVTAVNVNDLHSGAIAYLKTEFGSSRADQIVSAIKSQSASLKVVSACGASLRKAGSIDVALSLIDLDLGSVRYAISYEGIDQLEILSSSAAAPTTAGGWSKTPSVRCESWTAIERINRSLQRQAGATRAENNLKSISKLDAVCIAPMHSDFDFRCFAQSGPSLKLNDIGGWRND